MTDTVDPLDAAISSAFEGADTTAPAGSVPAQGDAQPVGGGQTAEQIGSVPLSDKTLEQLSATGDKRRAPDGKFTKADQAANPQAATAAKAAASPAQATQAQPARPVTVPQSWSAAAKAEWAKIPPTVQAEIVKRETDFHKGLEERTKSIGEKGKIADEFLEASRPYEAIIRAEGGTPVSAFKNLLNIGYILRTGTPDQKLQVVRETCQQWGIDPQGLIGQQQEVHPIVADLQGKISRLERQLHQRAEHEMQQQSQTLEQAITGFSTAVDESGNPKFPYFEQVRKHMAAILPTLDPNLSPQDALQKSYDQAVWANPETRQQLQDDMRAKELQQRDVQEREERAKRAGLSVRGAPNGASTARTHRPSLDEAVDSAFAAVGA